LSSRSGYITDSTHSVRVQTVHVLTKGRNTLFKLLKLVYHLKHRPLFLCSLIL